MDFLVTAPRLGAKQLMRNRKPGVKASPRQYKPSDSFWTPAALSGSQPFHATLAMARKLRPLNRAQNLILQEAESRPWDGPLQAWAQAALQAQAEEHLFPDPALVSQANLQNPARLAKKDILFIPSHLTLPHEMQAVLKDGFIYRGNTFATQNKARIYVSHKLMSHHELVVAQSGAGKTVRGMLMYLNARNQGRWAFVHSKAEEWEPVIGALRDQGVQPAMPPASMWKVNPLAPFGNANKSREHFVALLAQVEELPTYSTDILDMVVDEAYERFGAYNKPLPLDSNPTLTDLIKSVEQLDPKKVAAGVRNTLSVRLKSWQRQFGDWATPWPIEELARRSVIFPLSELNTKSARVAVERLQGPLFAVRETRPTKERTLLLHEEGRLVYTGNSQLAEDIGLLRAEGLWVYVMVQSTRDLAKSLLENTGIRSLGPVGHPSIAKQMQAAMGLSTDHLDVLRHQPVGTFIERFLYGHTMPLLVRAPFQKLRRPSQVELREARHALDDLPTKTREEDHEISVRTDNQPSKVELDEQALTFLHGVDEHPYLTTVTRFKSHGLNARVGNELKKKLVTQGLVEEKRVPLGLGGSPVLLQLTSQAQRLLGLEVRNQQVVHSFGQHIVEEHCRRFGAEARQEVDGVDVLAEINNESIALEVEVSGTNAAVNLVRNIKYDKIVVVAVGNQALKRLTKQLKPFIKTHSLQDRVILTTLGVVLKSEVPIWKTA